MIGRLPLALCLLSLISATTGMAGVRAGLPAAPPQTGDVEDPLFKTISALDSAVFEAFNHCDDPAQLKKYGDYFAPDLEFYHDNGGVTWTRQEMVANTARNVAGKYRRRLVPGSLRVYPIKGFGAIATGVHRFCQIGTGDCEGLADFTMVWRLQGGQWQITHALSYGHRANDATPSPGLDPMKDEGALGAWLKEQGIPVLGLGLIRDGKLKEVRVFGNLTGGGTAPLDTLFNVASLTKPVTAMVALRLASEGRWDLDEPLSHFWVDPDLKGDPRLPELTTRIVLSHRTGFLNWRWMAPSKKLAFIFEPGTKYQYSGEGFEYLRRALEAKFGTSLEDLAARTVFGPLGMRDTHFTWGKDVDEARFALGYDAKGSPYKLEKWSQANGADLLLTTVEDYGKFLAAVMSGKLLTEAIHKDMLRAHVDVKAGKAFALGWERYDLGGGDFALAHGGADEGVQTQVFLFPKTGQALILITNVDDGYKTYGPLLKHFMGAQGQKVFEIETAK
ncbi:serine hydrolase [Geothrix sp. PMB-07]|uniref:serine hydrolase n=1 Tax=Geothrix sp. PMB-07 TaxID=3068640 RepID=UPI0027422D61|nr:serine hydrolase [Geothrix sp. PMB-07]WLT30338.1 serine hydrolase [Geothrix sp. PMB-07]